jgi:phytoene dehydrogenase-like protein
VARVVMLGGGLNGLTAGMLLARDGHRVTILEPEALAAPGLVDTVMALGAGGPRYPAPGPGRAELLDALVT